MVWLVHIFWAFHQLILIETTALLLSGFLVSCYIDENAEIGI